jgi:putative (di)nucleoside polyphosphate hydrolase
LLPQVRLRLVAAAKAMALSGQLVLESRSVIDPDGYRPNVGIVLMRDDGSVFWARRIARDGWQFPQGGMNTDETPLEAMYRELQEETGLAAEHVEVLAATPGWLRYRLPRRCVRHTERPVCVGQKQVWYLLRLVADQSHVRLDATDSPEFVEFRWVDFWYPLVHVVSFKRDVYHQALQQLAPAANALAAGAGILARRPPPPLAAHRSGERPAVRRRFAATTVGA